MAYDRYAGMISLPGADGKMPRPFRVDEDGNVIYLDKEPDAVRRLGGDKGVQLVEAPNSNWNGYDAMRAQGQRDGRVLNDGFRSGSGDKYETREGVGLASRAPVVGTQSAKVRERYNPLVKVLAPDDRVGREALKTQMRTQSPSEIRGILDAVYPDKAGNPGSTGRANVPNERVSQQARVFGRIGRGMGVLGTGLAVADIAQSDNKARATIANIGAAIGGAVGGAGGAAAGASTGPFAVVAAPAGGVVGATAGGKLGYKAGEATYDLGEAAYEDAARILKHYLK